MKSLKKSFECTFFLQKIFPLLFFVVFKVYVSKLLKLVQIFWGFGGFCHS